ncbi:DUF1254 domain-containing protein [Leifsonia shinshuensis]|uniref:DUF1254 domain-containing protein n=1 Tax=Leifsonia shinshuensis TaxID=150026 RepID=UPI0028625986|nr:DUF1254 domain-containing protein [Leifsonia shinshuensis]MDR6973120.1 hypothetical protein [Leifsonia shinshuensis]
MTRVFRGAMEGRVQQVTEELTELATEAFVVGFPLVFDLEQVVRFTEEGIGSIPATPYNVFGHARRLAGPDDAFVSVNNDTVYSIAQIDLSVGPLRLSVPAAGDRYHVLQFVDAWTNNFAYIGTRATGGAGGEYLLLPPESEGDPDAGAEAGIPAIRFPTRVATIVGRWAVDGDDDLPAVHALQDALTLTQVRESLAPAQGVPVVATGQGEALDFFEKLRVWSQAFPPAERDRPALDSYAPLGLVSPYPIAEQPEGVRDALAAGYALGKEALESSLSTAIALVDHWQANLHMFDYNLDFFELGTLDGPEWTLPEPRTRYAHRAAAALGGLWGNHAYEAAYLMTYEDQDGEPLSGEHSYRLRLHPLPPVGAFWSITMYDVPNFYLVRNPIERYSIGDRTRGLVYDDDGGLTITMSATRPTDERAAANWLPTPAGAFRPVLRLYAPGDEVMDGRWAAPAIERIG